MVESHAARAPLPKGPVAGTFASSSPVAGNFASSSPAARALASRSPAAVAPATNESATRASAANSPAVKALARIRPAAKALVPGAPAANVPTFRRLPGNSSFTSVSSASNFATPVPSASAEAVRNLGAVSSPAGSSGPGASGPMTSPLAEQCSLGHEQEENKVYKEEDEEEEDSDDELCSDEDLSSWGSDEEIWGSDSEFYDTDDEEEGPIAGQYTQGLPAVRAVQLSNKAAACVLTSCTCVIGLHGMGLCHTVYMSPHLHLHALHTTAM